ncbi:MAG: hAT transposon family protein [Desulfobulbaceae bacterium]|nr:hAT transposon family protein [Desulfobulbaceae bacterium]
MAVVDLMLCIPASSAENERGFSLMKLTKSDRRSRLTIKTLSELMAIQLLTPKVDEYNPEDAIQAWMGSGKGKRRVNDGPQQRPSKRVKTDVEQEIEAEVEVEEDIEEEVQYAAVADVDDNCHDEEDDDEGFEDFDDEMGEEEVHRHISKLL